jgi:ribosome maturation factor RimP
MDGQVPLSVGSLIDSVAAELGCRVYHAGLSGRTLRIEIDKDGGVSARECAAFARALTGRIGSIEPQRGTYGLEVSSPGLERRLYRPADYVKAVGRRVVVRSRQGTFDGALVSAGDESVTLKTAGGTGTVVVPFADIREAQVKVGDAELFRPARQAVMKGCNE